MSLATPEKIRSLQRKLYRKAKQEPTFRFYQLYDKVYRADILEHAYLLCRSNGGSSGVDGVTFEQIEAQGLGEWLERLRKELHDKTYRPQAVRRVMIPKPGGGERPLGIPTIRERVVQSAAKLLLEPIFEADFADEAFGYRPRRSAQDAVKAVHQSLRAGYTEVVDADLSKYFDTIPHRELMKSVARRIVDRQMLRLIRMWLKVPVEERDAQGNKRMSGGKRSKVGTPQGGVISPLLANVYMHRFLRYWRQTGQGERLQARIINYADWSNYFGHGTLYYAYRAVDNHLYDRVRHFLRRRHKVKSGGTSLLPPGKSLREWGVVRLLDVLKSRRHAYASR